MPLSQRLRRCLSLINVIHATHWTGGRPVAKLTVRFHMIHRQAIASLPVW